jgi:hypothetical protein
VLPVVVVVVAVAAVLLRLNSLRLISRPSIRF